MLSWSIAIVSAPMMRVMAHEFRTKRPKTPQRLRNLSAISPNSTATSPDITFLPAIHPGWIGRHPKEPRVKYHHRKRKLGFQFRHRRLLFLLLRFQPRSLVQSIAIALIVVCLDEAEVGVPILRKWECIFARRLVRSDPASCCSTPTWRGNRRGRDGKNGRGWGRLRCVH
jgi:hypothetical protein